MDEYELKALGDKIKGLDPVALDSRPMRTSALQWTEGRVVQLGFS